MSMFPTFAAAALTVFLTGCSTHQASLEYDPRRAPGLTADGRGNVSVGVFKDARGVPDTYLGQIREAGPVQKKLETSVPVARIVENTFGYGMQVRRMLGQQGTGFLLSGTINEFSCDQFVRAGASADITVQLRGTRGNRVLFSKTYTAENTEATAKIGVLGDPQILKSLASRTLQQVVDKALDDPELRGITDGDE
ncbi:MAG: hypothetical protein KA004_15975 [Verrucomicrobiales bacterium]|nr:hypothetical protein [Verrucomicrobiales bacterium]